HSVAVVTFALCGFANVTTLAILIGGMGSLIPERRPFIAKYGARAVMAGVLANLMSAAIVSIILSL
ncbi:nucleoside transporter C-terminal domain-containing protein, partial [Photobacterium damselae]